MFDNNTRALESFMDYSAEVVMESVFTTAKASLVNIFSKLVLWIEGKVKKMKDGKIKKLSLELLSRAKRGLAKSKSLKDL